MKVKIKFEKLQDVNCQYNSCDIVFYTTYRLTDRAHHFRFHENHRIYAYHNYGWSIEMFRRFCKRMGKEYTWDNGFW